MKNFYPHGHVMPGGDGSGERHPTSRATLRREPAEDLSTALRTYSLVKFNSYRKRGKAGSPPATTSNPYDVLKRVNWLAVFSPWAIINRSKAYRVPVKQTSYGTRTSSKNVALKDLAIVTGGTTVVPNRACELSEGNIFSGEFFGSFFGVKKERPVAASDGKVAGWENRLKRSKTIHTPFPSILHLLLPTIFASVFICFSGAAKAQSRPQVGTAEAVCEVSADIKYNDELERKVQSTHNSSMSARLAKYRPDIDLLRFPVIQYKISDAEQMPRAMVGQLLDERILDLPLWVVSHETVSDTLTIRSLAKDRMLVLDFWAGFCAPCIRSINHWEETYPFVSPTINVLGVHIDYDYKVRNELAKRGWNLKHVIGKSATILTHYFFGTPTVGPMVWIKDGRLWQITKPSDSGSDYILDIAAGRTSSIPDSALWFNNNL